MREQRVRCTRASEGLGKEGNRSEGGGEQQRQTARFGIQTYVLE